MLHPHYRNITISGLPGSGSTTLLRELKDALQFDGWKGFSGGEFMRAYAQEKGLFQATGGLHHDASHYEDDFDRQVDMGMREKLQKESKWILESWLSGFLAQQVPNTLKVLIMCSDEAVKIDRVVNRDGVSVDAVKDNLRQRYDSNYHKWSRMYAEQWHEWVVAPGTLSPEAEIDFWHPSLYDVVVDTYSHNKAATLQLVLDALAVHNHGQGVTV